jgi:pyruvate dehydrogenase E1 component alpha subunit
MAIHVDRRTLSATALLDMYRKMVTIRQFELKVIDLYNEGLIRGSTHTYIGMEAIAVGACATLRPDDYITSTHRGHGHCIAKGGRVDLMMAELLGKATGYCKGKGGSMHIADVEAGILGANGIVGGSIGIATGAALSAKMRQSGQVCICFFGDGAINQGILYECANMAAIWKLPVIYLCENNQYAMSTHISYAASVPDLSIRAVAFGMPGMAVDGMDVLAVHDAVRQAVERARAGEGPSLIVANAYRFEGHNVGDTQVYRTKEEVERWRERDPIVLFRTLLLEDGILTPESAEAIEREVAEQIEAAVAFAKASPEPPVESLLEDIYA